MSIRVPAPIEAFDEPKIESDHLVFERQPNGEICACMRPSGGDDLPTLVEALKKGATVIRFAFGSYDGLERRDTDDPEPIPMLLLCPYCKEKHVDRGEWSTTPHRTHLCEHCGKKWRPAWVPTVGIDVAFRDGLTAYGAVTRERQLVEWRGERADDEEKEVSFKDDLKQHLPAYEHPLHTRTHPCEHDWQPTDLVFGAVPPQRKWMCSRCGATEAREMGSTTIKPVVPAPYPRAHEIEALGALRRCAEARFALQFSEARTVLEYIEYLERRVTMEQQYSAELFSKIQRVKALFEDVT